MLLTDAAIVKRLRVSSRCAVSCGEGKSRNICRLVLHQAPSGRASVLGWQMSPNGSEAMFSSLVS